MRRIRFLIAGLLLIHYALSQSNDGPSQHDKATDLAAEVFFGQAQPVRERHKAFEKANGVKLHFTVADASLDKLGGLSEHLFKIYKTLTTPVRTNAKTITGEFSLLSDEVLDNLLRYKTHATSELRNCALPDDQSRRLDSIYTSQLLPHDEQAIATENINLVLTDACAAYERILRKNGNCNSESNNEYDQHVLNTAASRQSSWRADAQGLSNQLSVNLGLLRSTSSGTGKTNENDGNSGVKVKVNLNSLVGKYIISLNKSVNECTWDDMEARCGMLYEKAKIRYFFVTQTLDYFLPRDSSNHFRDLATASFSTELTEDIIVALYLKMRDPSTGATGTSLLVKQFNGEWLTTGDIAYAIYNNGGNYHDGTYYRFSNLFKNIPKPLMICYQVAKVNGHFTTMYLEKNTPVKGWEQIYQHVFKIDKYLPEVARLAEEINTLQKLQFSGGGGGSIMGATGVGGETKTDEQIAELRTRQKIEFLKSAIAPEFMDADVTFREAYLDDPAITQASALKYLKLEYGGLYDNHKFDELIGNTIIPPDIEAGSCLTPDNSDAIGDFLDFSSLILSPFGVDFVPDALATVYYAATEQHFKMAMAGLSVAMLGNLNGTSTILTKSTDLVTSANKGSKLFRNGATIEAIAPDVSYLTGFFNIPPTLVDPAFASKIRGNVAITKKLTAMDVSGNLPVNSAQAKIWRNTEKLPPAKRLEFVNKCYDDVEFRTKCFNDPDEVLRWGGYFLEKQRERLASLTKEYGALDYNDFTTIGGKSVEEIPSTTLNEMLVELSQRTSWTLDQKKAKITELISSGSTIPVKIVYNSGQELYKVVKKGALPSQTTEYWLTKTELDKLMAKGSKFESCAALPLGSYSEEYDIYKIVATDNCIVFQSQISGSIQRGHTSTGGAVQSLVLNRSAWSIPTKINTSTFIPDY